MFSLRFWQEKNFQQIVKEVPLIFQFLKERQKVVVHKS